MHLRAHQSSAHAHIYNVLAHNIIYLLTHTHTQGANKLREKIEPNEKPTDIPESVQKGVHYTRKATGCVVGVSNFLMTSLARLTVKVGKGVGNMVAESEVWQNKAIYMN